MIKKLLFYVSSLFSIFTNSSKERSFKLSLKMLCLGMFFVVNFGFAQTKTWTGASGTNWNTSTNWSPNGTPDSTFDVIIPSGTTNSPIIGSDVSAKSLNISGTLTIGNNNNDRDLDVVGSVTINAGGQLISVGNGGNALEIGGDLVNNGTFDMYNGGRSAITTFNGTVTQTISGSGAITDFYDVFFANNSSLVLNRTIRVYEDWENNGKTVSGTGTVIFNGTGSVVRGSALTNFPNVIASSGTTSFSVRTVVTQNLSILSGALVSLNNILTHTAVTLTLNGNGQNNGTWGSTAAANTATYKNSTYFGTTGTGILTVGTPTCTTGYWTGTTSTDWNTASNWCGNAVPGLTTDVVIQSGTPFSPIIGNFTALTRSLTINNSTTLTMSNNAASMLQIAGNFANNGTFTTTTNNTISFVGGANQSIGTIPAVGTISMLKTGGTATMTGSLTASNALLINGANSTLNLGVGFSHTFPSVTLTAGTLNGGSSTLNLSGATPFTGTLSNFVPATGTVNLNGAAQNTTLTSFYNLTLSGTGTKTFTGVTAITNILSIANTNAKANLQSFAGEHTAGSLLLAGSTRTFGTYGGGNASTSTYKEPNYITNTSSIVRISRDACQSFAVVAPIVNVTFNSLNNTSNASSASALPYEDFTATGGTATTTVVKGQSYALSVKGNTNGDVNAYYTAFFDFNNNGAFTDLGEGPFPIGSIRNSNGSDSKTASAYINIPSSATGTNIKMRIVAQLNSYSNSTGCTTSSNTGQVEEYTITLQVPCTGNLTPGLTNSSANPVCPNAPFVLSLQNTITDGATYTWQTSTDNSNWSSAATYPTNFFGLETFDTATNPDANVYGVATISGGQLILTPAVNSLLGAYVIQKTPGINIDAFTVNFNYQIPTTGGADGFSLSYAGDVQNNDGGGESGSGSGLIVQFDTYDNEGVAGGGGSRIRIQYAGTTYYNSAINAPQLRPTTGKTPVIIRVDAAGKLTLTVNNSVVVANLALPAAYLAAVKSNWRFKFAARTGGSNDQHIIDDLQIRYLDITGTGPTFTTSQTARTYYRVMITCGSSTTYSTSVLVNMTTATINNMTASTCHASAFTVTPADPANGTIPSGTTYSWPAPVVQSGITGGASSTGNPTSITGTLNNTTSGPLTATYTVTPTTSGCTGPTFTVTVTVNPLPAITTQPQPLTLCVGTGGSFTVATSASSPTYQWQYSTSTSGPWTNTDGNAGVSGHTTATLTLANTVPVSYSGYYLRCVITSNTCVNNSDPALLTVNALPTITTAANPAVVTATCVTTGATSTTMAYNSASGNPTAYSIAWTGLAAQGTTSNTFVAGGGSISGIVIPAGTASGTYTGVMTIRNATTCTTTLNITLTVKPNYSAPTVGTITQPTCTTTTGSVVLTGLPATGNLFQNNGTTTVNVAITGSSTTVTGLAPGTYRFAVDNGCAVNYSANVVIAGSNTWNGSSWSYGRDPILSDAITFTGNYSLNADINACSCTVTNAAVVTIKTGKTMHIVNGVFVGTTSSLTFENNASLTQDNTSNTLNTGVISYIRDTYPIRQADYTYWSSPVKGQTLGGVSPDTEDDKYYSFTSPGWVSENISSVMTAGKGYIIRGPEYFSNTARAVYTATFKGVPNNGDITGETAVANTFYLVGNPYPSALNADEFIGRNNFLEGTLYFWTHNTPVVLGGYYRYSTDDYAVYNLSGGTATRPALSAGNPSDTNASTPLGYIAAGQSFFAGAVQSGVFKFDNLMRAGQNHNSQFFKPGSASKTTALEKNRLWINMTNTEGAFKQILVGYIEGATNAYERKYDGTTLDGNKYLDFYSISDGKRLVIQGRGLPFTDTDTVPLGYRSTIAGDFTISIESADGTMETQAVYLEDKLTGAIHDLRASNYTFTTAIGTFADRLVLRYTNKTLGTGDFENIENGIVVSSKDKAIQVFSSKENIQEVTIFDITGKLLYNKKKVGSTQLNITDLQIGNQVLLVKVSLENGHHTSRKVIFQ